MKMSFDAIVIGAGQAGPALAGRLSGAGLSVAMVERHWFGGTCVNTGCTPTKALVASAEVAHQSRRATEYGVCTGTVTVDMRAIKARKDRIVAAARNGLESWLLGLPHCTVFRGHARFQTPREISVGADLLSADRIFINVGGRALRPAIPGIDRVPYLTNTSILELDHLPPHLVIIGGSYIGLEFAQMYRRFGSEVTVIERAPRLVSHEDADVSTAIEQLLANEGITIRTHADCIRLEPRGPSIAAGVNCTAGSPQVLGTHLLLAVGRRPNTDDLGLEAAGIAVDPHGYITVDQ